jgi:hypothetical protein
MTSYSLEDYSNITFNGFDYKLQLEVIDIIKKMSIDLGINTSVNYQADTRAKRQGDQSNRLGIRGKAKEGDESWERTRAFKSTKIEKKEGIDKTINDIRACLNKLSESNYDAQRDVLFQHIAALLEQTPETDSSSNSSSNSSEQDMLKIATSVFDIASTNKFYSEIYAILYKELTCRFPVFKDIIIRFISQYLENIGKIQLVDSNVNYDLYCENNKNNDKRKAMSSFLVNLMKLELVQMDEILNIILMLQETVLSYVDQENKSCEVEEITENIYIFVLTLITNINKGGDKKKDAKKFSEVLETLLNNVKYEVKDLICLDKWAAIMENITKCSQFKSKEHLSISSRTVFRYMDILDVIKAHR